MKIAVYGLGSMGARHVANLRAMGHEVRGADVRPERLTDLALELPDGDEDAAVIATPAESHRLQMCPRLHFVEKPLSTDVISARSGFRCDDGHVPGIQVGYNWRFHPGVNALRAAIRGRQLGRVLSARLVYGHGLDLWRPGVAPEQLPYAKTGILLEASHELDLIRWIFGDTRVVGAWLGRRRWDIPAEDTAIAILEAAGVPIELHLDMTKPMYWRSILIDTDCNSVHLELGPGEVERTYVEEIAAFCRWVATGDRDERAATFVDGLAVLELIEEIRRKAA